MELTEVRSQELVERAKQYAADCLECAADQRQNHMTEMPVRYWNAMAADWAEVARRLASPPTPVPIEGLVERLKRVDEEDHTRGCQGRAYDCSCGYDDLVLIAASDARAALTQMAGDLRDRDLTISVEQGKVTYRDKLLAAAESRATALAAEIEMLKDAAAFDKATFGAERDMKWAAVAEVARLTEAGHTPEVKRLMAEVERLKETNQKQYDDGYTHGLGFAKLERKAKGKRLARFVMTGDMAEASKTGETVSAEVERLTYELKRWKEATAQRPDWEKLWAEQADRAEAAEASLAEALAWAVERWNAEVKNRPLVNVHRRSLDDCWRQVMLRFGGDPDALCGPSHDDLLVEARLAALGREGEAK